MRNKVKVRQARVEDIPRLLEIDEEIWPGFRASGEMFLSRIKTFPEGQFVATANGQIIGSIFTQLVDYQDLESRTFTWDEVTDTGTIRKTHTPDGDSVYGVGLAVGKKYQDGSASRLLIIRLVRLAISMNKRQILLGSRIPAYHKHSEMPVEEYIHARRGKSEKFLDPELAFYQKYDGEQIKPLPNYMDDPESLNFGVLVRWKNPFCGKPIRRRIMPFVLMVFPDIS